MHKGRNGTALAAGIYCRISEDRLGAGLGVERQREDCEKLAATKGWTVVETYVDNDISAYSGKLRPAYRRLLADLDDGSIQAVVVWHLDRLHRQPKELESFIELVEGKSVALASVSGEHDLGTPEGRLYARILGAVARAESEHKSRRIRRKMLEVAQAGKPMMGGYRPYGYADDRVTVVPHEASVIRDASRRLLAGESLRSVCLDLNARGERTTQETLWTQRVLKRVLVRPRNAGLREHPEVGQVKATWPAILTDDEWKPLTALLSDPRRGRRGAPRRHMLSGILRCGECGQRMVAGPAWRGSKRKYVCMAPPYGCNRVSIVADWVESFVAEAVLGVLANPTASNGDHPERDTTDLDAIAADRALLDELAGAYAVRKITMSEWLVARDPIESRIGNAQMSIADQARDSAVRRLTHGRVDLRTMWPSLDVEKQRGLIESVLDHIVVNRVGQGRYRDSSRLAPAWRQ
jgi:DNA invertase Pin-like site-specific DNA recombinase